MLQIHLTDSILRRIEDKLCGQNFLFKVQLKDHFDYPVIHPFTVNKACKTLEIVEKYIPEGFVSEPISSQVKLSDLLFGDDLAEVFISIIILLLCVLDVIKFFTLQVSEKSFQTPDLSSIENDNNSKWIEVGTVKRCLDMEFDACEDYIDFEALKRQKVNGGE